MMKTCRGCSVEKPLADYYKHSNMADGHLNHCADCCKKRIKAHRRNNPDVYTAREADRYVGDRRSKIADGAKRRAAASPHKRRAHITVGNAVRDGRLHKPDACSLCGRTGTRIEGHHDDYTKPLVVIWFCCRCHRRHHADNPHLEA